MPVERQLPRLMSVLAIPIALHIFVGGPWAMAPLAFIAGLFIAPSLTGATLLISRHAPPQYVTEAFTWSATAIVTGIGAGMAVAGGLVEHSDARAAFALAVASMLAGALFTLALRREHLQIQPEEPR
jgi:predicted MFS family arabinose efflux permease